MSTYVVHVNYSRGAIEISEACALAELTPKKKKRNTTNENTQPSRRGQPKDMQQATQKVIDKRKEQLATSVAASFVENDSDASSLQEGVPQGVVTRERRERGQDRSFTGVRAKAVCEVGRWRKFGFFSRLIDSIFLNRSASGAFIQSLSAISGAMAPRVAKRVLVSAATARTHPIHRRRSL